MISGLGNEVIGMSARSRIFFGVELMQPDRILSDIDDVVESLASWLHIELAQLTRGYDLLLNKNDKGQVPNGIQP